MGNLTQCLQQAGELLPAELRAAIHKRAGELRRDGMSPIEAARAAVAEQQAAVKAGLDEVEPALASGATLYEPVTDTPAAKAEVEAAGSRVDQVVREMPALMVRMDDMDAPMSAADFMAQVRAQADEMEADAPLFQVAAECALLNGL